MLAKFRKRTKAISILCSRSTAFTSLILSIISLQALAAVPNQTTDNTDDKITIAIESIMKNDLNSALAAAKQSVDPHYTKSIVELLHIYNNPNTIIPSKAMGFLQSYAWIPEEIFISKIERSINHETKPEEIITWFSYKKPTNNRSKFFFLHAQLKLNKANLVNNKIKQDLRTLWRNTEFSLDTENYIINEYKGIFTIDDLLQKIDHFIWNGNVSYAKKLVDLLPNTYQTLPKIKLTVTARPELLNKYLNSVTVKNDELIRYLYIKNLFSRKVDLSAIKSLTNIQPKSNFEKWWKLKNLAFREAVNNKNYSIAYSLTQNHGMETGASFADAEWYAGWVALEFLKKPDTAIKHFSNMYNGTKLANSKSKGAYWLARAYDIKKIKTQANHWYNEAAIYSSTFYGQLALAQIKGNTKYNYFNSYKDHKDRIIVKPDKNKIRKITLLAYHLFKANQKFLAYTIIDYIPTLNLERIDLEASAFFFSKRNLRPLAVELGKSTANRSFILIKEGYPTNLKIVNTALPKALYLAVIRQESNFDHTATSQAGARGLMQLMPQTAIKLAQTLQLPKDAYIYDPNANIRKGSTYLDQLYSKYGNIILTIAAYNAGPGNVKKWIDTIGDPRNMTILERVNWIETIPFAETRSYVKKVMENMVIYDSMLTSNHNAKTIIKFLEL
jgi:soluble lytic murein transglycosylase